MRQPPSPQRCASVVLESLPALMQRLRQIMRDARGSLTVPQFRVLAFLERAPGSSLAAIADFIGIGKATASAMISTLERDGLVLRKPGTDRRIASMHASPAGKRLLTQARSATRSRIAERLTGLDQTELLRLEQAFALLDRCFANDPPADLTGT